MEMMLSFYWLRRLETSVVECYIRQAKFVIEWVLCFFLDFGFGATKMHSFFAPINASAISYALSNFKV